MDEEVCKYLHQKQILCFRDSLPRYDKGAKKVPTPVPVVKLSTIALPYKADRGENTLSKVPYPKETTHTPINFILGSCIIDVASIPATERAKITQEATGVQLESFEKYMDIT